MADDVVMALMLNGNIEESVVLASQQERQEDADDAESLAVLICISLLDQRLRGMSERRLLREQVGRDLGLRIPWEHRMQAMSDYTFLNLFHFTRTEMENLIQELRLPAVFILAIRFMLLRLSLHLKETELQLSRWS